MSNDSVVMRRRFGLLGWRGKAWESADECSNDVRATVAVAALHAEWGVLIKKLRV